MKLTAFWLQSFKPRRADFNCILRLDELFQEEKHHSNGFDWRGFLSQRHIVSWVSFVFKSSSSVLCLLGVVWKRFESQCSTQFPNVNWNRYYWSLLAPTSRGFNSLWAGGLRPNFPLITRQTTPNWLNLFCVFGYSHPPHRGIEARPKVFVMKINRWGKLDAQKETIRQDYAW